MAYINLNTVLLLALVVLVPPKSLSQTLGDGPSGDTVELQVEGNVMCSATGNQVEGGRNIGAANASVRLMCGKMGVAAGVTDEKGHFHMSAQVKDEVGELVKRNECGVRVNLPVPNCTALNHQGALYGTATVKHMAAEDKVLCLLVRPLSIII